MTLQSTFDAVGSAISGLAESVTRAFGDPFGGYTSTDPYNYGDTGFLPGEAVYNLAPPSAILYNGPLQLGGYAHRSDSNGALDGYVRTFEQLNNLADSNPAKHAMWFVNPNGGAPGAVNVNMDGNAKANLMVGTAGVNRMNGNDGADTMLAREGNDTVFGGNGNDKITGGTGKDFLSGGAGLDEYHGGADNDTLIAETGDEVWTGAGSDIIRAGNIRIGSIKNFNPNYDRFDFVDANVDHYNATNVSGLVINQGPAGWNVGWGVNASEGKLTLTHDSNGLSSVVTLSESYLNCGSRAEAEAVKADILSWSGADEWFI